MNFYSDVIERALRLYNDEYIRRIHVAASLVEKEGYCIWPRIREIAEFARKAGFRKLGIVFCIGLSNEARMVAEYLSKWGFEVYTLCCKCGSVDKTWIGLSENDKLRPGSHEAMCNPIVQAEILNEIGTDLNIVVGLCVGHDSLFMKFSKAPVTYLIVKDRVTGHNPAVALYAQHYFRRRLGLT